MPRTLRLAASGRGLRRHAVVAAAIGVVIFLLVAAPGGAARLARAQAAPSLSTAAYLEMPEIFQLSVVSGSLAVLERWAAEADDPAADACYRRWASAEDVAALVSLHVRRTPGALEAPFADTLIAALQERCAGR